MHRISNKSNCKLQMGAFRTRANALLVLYRCKYIQNIYIVYICFLKRPGSIAALYLPRYKMIQSSFLLAN